MKHHRDARSLYRYDLRLHADFCFARRVIDVIISLLAAPDSSFLRLLIQFILYQKRCKKNLLYILKSMLTQKLPEKKASTGTVQTDDSL